MMPVRILIAKPFPTVASGTWIGAVTQDVPASACAPQWTDRRSNFSSGILIDMTASSYVAFTTRDPSLNARQIPLDFGEKPHYSCVFREFAG